MFDDNETAVAVMVFCAAYAAAGKSPGEAINLGRAAASKFLAAMDKDRNEESPRSDDTDNKTD